MKIIKITLCLLLAVYLSACSSTPTKKSNEIVKNLQSERGLNDYYIFRENAFGGAIATVVVHCNNDQYRLGTGDFVKCPSSENLNYISANVGDGVYFTEALENNENVLNSNQSKIYLNDNSDSKFFLLSTSILSDVGMGLNTEINKSEAVSLIEDGYEYVDLPSRENSILRSSSIMNPYTDFEYGFINVETKLPPYMQLVDNKIINEDKQGVVIFSAGRLARGNFGIWTRKGFKGSLVDNSFIFFESDNLQETIYTYYGGKIVSLDVPLKKGEQTFVSLDSSMGWSSHNRNIDISSSEIFELRLPLLDYLKYNKEADTPISMSIIEQEGLKILNTLNPEF